jgi:hypothetical protein
MPTKMKQVESQVAYYGRQKLTYVEYFFPSSVDINVQLATNHVDVDTKIFDTNTVYGHKYLFVSLCERKLSLGYTKMIET